MNKKLTLSKSAAMGVSAMALSIQGATIMTTLSKLRGIRIFCAMIMVLATIGHTKAATISFIEGAEGTLPSFVIGSDWITPPTCVALDSEFASCMGGTFADTTAPDTPTFDVSQAFLVEPDNTNVTSEVVQFRWTRRNGVVTNLQFDNQFRFTSNSELNNLAPPGCASVVENGGLQELTFCGSLVNNRPIPGNLHVFVQSDVERVPEPPTVLLVAFGLVGLAAVALRRRRR